MASEEIVAASACRGLSHNLDISEAAQDTYRGRAGGLGGGDSDLSAINNWPLVLWPRLTTTSDINDG